MNWFTRKKKRNAAVLASEAHHPLLTESGYWESSGPSRLVIYSGAGLSVESGMATFSTDNGLWENHKIEEVCDGQTWRQHRALVEAFYDSRAQDNVRAKPHAGHQWCAQAESEGAALITQNVDTLLERAGARFVRHIHGRIDQRQCWHCSLVWEAALHGSKHCPLCKSDDTRVNVVFYKEPAPEYANASRTIGGLREKDVLLVVGTQATVSNPLRWLSGKAQVWVVDPKPSSELLGWPGVVVWEEPASRVGETAGQAWERFKRA